MLIRGDGGKRRGSCLGLAGISKIHEGEEEWGLLCCVVAFLQSRNKYAHLKMKSCF